MNSDAEREGKSEDEWMVRLSLVLMATSLSYDETRKAVKFAFDGMTFSDIWKMQLALKKAEYIVDGALWTVPFGQSTVDRRRRRRNLLRRRR